MRAADWSNNLYFNDKREHEIYRDSFVRVFVTIHNLWLVANQSWAKTLGLKQKSIWNHLKYFTPNDAVRSLNIIIVVVI